MVNDNGGLLGRKVKLKILDDQSNADRVVADYEQLLGKDEVDLVFGPFSTRLVVPSARVAEEYGMVFVEPAGAAPEVFEQGFKNLFYAAPAVADDHYNHLADHVVNLPEAQRPKTAAYAAMDDPFAQGTAYGLKEKLEQAGIKTVVNEVYPPNTTDFSSIAAKIKASKADVLVGGSQYQDGVNLIVALQQLDYQPKLAAFSTAPTSPEFAKAIGNKTEGVLSPTGYTQDAPFESNKEFVEKYTKQFGNAPEEDEANAYTTGQVVAAAVEAVGCAEQGECQKKLVKWLRDNEVETVVGPLSWDQAGRPQGAHMIQQWVGGEIKIVLPEDVKEADFVYPKPTW
ncbi:MAG: ABC transporter substrate-binding protein [Micromonosporaceae bacterium]|nr:ABC transporter substrate-binding protein [Micromonosporaceae bacterium]